MAMTTTTMTSQPSTRTRQKANKANSRKDTSSQAFGVSRMQNSGWVPRSCASFITLSEGIKFIPRCCASFKILSQGNKFRPRSCASFYMFFYLFSQAIVITPTQVGLPLCKWCRRPIKTDVKRHQNRCFWCTTCDDFVAADVARHRCTVPDADAIACPICGSINKNNNHLRHLRQVHPDVDAELYRRSSESSTQRDRRLEREGKVWNIICFK